MRLKEIKPGMVITCTHREEVIELWDYLNKNHGTPNDDEYGIDEMLKCYMEGYHFKINGDEWEEVADGGIPYATSSHSRYECRGSATDIWIYL